ncbi:MAG: hypothetical protein AAAFM81_14560 [Pseudomonadota bacterium]
MRACSALVLVMLSALPTGSAADALYDDEGILEVTLTAPMRQILRDKDNPERPYFDGTFGFSDPINGNVIVNVGTRARGNYRREHCRYIPLQLNFKKSEVPTTYFKKQNKIKLVRGCKPGRRAEDWLLLEYLGYQVWQTVSDYHFRTRLLEITYVDTDRDGKSRQGLAFIIESDNDTAKRLDASIVETRIQRGQLDEAHTALFEIFQFFMANSDYSTTRVAEGRKCCHNTRLMDFTGDATGLHLVPYDFDHSGLVNTSYASPPDWLADKITSVRQRQFIGVCKSDDALWQVAIERFQEERDTIRALLDNKRLTNGTRRATLRFFDDFYDILDDPKKIQRFIIDQCQGGKRE